jgi:hypothetical protein
MPARLNSAPMVTSSAAGEPVAGSCAGATAGPAAGASTVGSTVGCVGGTTLIDDRGDDVDVETNAVVGAELLELEGMVDDELELGGTLDEELEELGGTLEELDELEELELEELDELELGATLDDELLDAYGSIDGSLATEIAVLTMDVLDVWVSTAPAGPHSIADAPNSTPIPSTIHPALVDRSMTHLRSRQKT